MSKEKSKFILTKKDWIEYTNLQILKDHTNAAVQYMLSNKSDYLAFMNNEIWYPETVIPLNYSARLGTQINDLELKKPITIYSSNAIIGTYLKSDKFDHFVLRQNPQTGKWEQSKIKLYGWSITSALAIPF